QGRRIQPAKDGLWAQSGAGNCRRRARPRRVELDGRPDRQVSTAQDQGHWPLDGGHLSSDGAPPPGYLADRRSGAGGGCAEGQRAEVSPDVGGTRANERRVETLESGRRADPLALLSQRAGLSEDVWATQIDCATGLKSNSSRYSPIVSCRFQLNLLITHPVHPVHPCSNCTS